MGEIEPTYPVGGSRIVDELLNIPSLVGRSLELVGFNIIITI